LFYRKKYRLYNTCFTGRNIDYTILVLQEEIESNITLLKEKDREIKEALQKVENQDKLDIDEAVITTTPLYRQ
jgi:low affinity Fe/Cu permease